MNMLNSLILEGNVVKECSLIPNGKCFDIEVLRYYKNADGDMVEDKSIFTVELCGNLASETITNKLKEGRGVRIVGRLKQKRWKEEDGKEYSRIVVIAEHLEFKPDFRKAKKDLI